MHKIIALKLTACSDCTQKLYAYKYTYAKIYTIYKSLNFVHNGFPYPKVTKLSYIVATYIYTCNFDCYVQYVIVASYTIFI